MFVSFLGLVFLIKEKIMISIICFLLIIVIFLIYMLKKKKLKKKLIEYEESVKASEMSEIVNAEIFKLIKLMNKIGLDKDIIDYTSNNFTENFYKCEKYEDYKKLYNRVFDTVKKYKNYSKEFIMKENVDINDEIIQSLSVLGLPMGTTNWNIIKNKYRKLLKLIHPDINNSKINEIKTKELNVAYNILKKYYRK